MDIRSLHSEFRRNDETEKVNRGQKSGTDAVKKTGESKAEAGDKVSISSVNFDGDVDFARSILQNLREQSFDNLRQVRSNIQNGKYDNDDIQSKMVDSIQSELFAVEAGMQTDSASESSESPRLNMDEALKQRLLQDSEVLERISSRLLDDISNL